MTVTYIHFSVVDRGTGNSHRDTSFEVRDVDRGAMLLSGIFNEAQCQALAANDISTCLLAEYLTLPTKTLVLELVV